MSEPIVRPLSWMVAATSVAVVILGARMVSGRRVRLPESVVPAAEKPAPPASPRPERRPPSFRPGAPARPERPASGLAHLRGRVMAPAGSDLDELKVVADDGTRGHLAELNAAGEFQLHLPARSYTLTARADGLVAARVVHARPGEGEGVILTLAPGALISGLVRYSAKEGQTVVVTADSAGTSLTRMAAEVDEDGRFELEALVEGSLYDVTVTLAGGGPSKVIRAVRAPATLEVLLPAPVTLRGAIGFAAGTTCPFRQVALESPEDKDETLVDRNCHFRFDDLVPGQEVSLKARGLGWFIEERLSLPAQGDPPPVCLNPPCRELRPEESPRLDVILTGAPSSAHLTVAASQGESAGMGCSTSGHECALEGLEVGVPVQLSVSAPGCVSVERQVTPAPGANTISIPCRRMRLVEGVARGTDPRQITTILCKDGGETHLRGNAIFELHCPLDQTELLYRRGARDPWRRAPLAPQADPAFIELTL